MSETSLKQENAKTLRYFLAANFSMFLVIVASTGIGDLESSTLNRVAETLGPWAVLGPLAVSVLLGIVPRSALELLIFHRLRDPLPGHRAFSQFALADERVNVGRLGARLGSLPTKGTEQNQAWYALSIQHRDDPGVRDAHRLYLLTRDATALATLSLVILGGIVVGIVRPSALVSTVYVSALILQVMMIAAAARNYAERFVCNVLAVASTV